MAEKKGITVESFISPNIKSIESDKRRVEQILLNLVNNSIKFTETGGVKITCHADIKGITVSVADTGIGIADEDRDRLFKAFQQIETGLSRRYEGTGSRTFNM